MMRFRFACLVVGFLSVLLPASGSAGEEPRIVGTIGTTVRFMELHDTSFVAAEIPLATVSYPVADRFFYVTFGWHAGWGLSRFYVDDTISLGAQWYPVGRILSVYGNGHVGSFLFNNLTFMAGAGADLEIPVSRSAWIVVGAETFTRKVSELAGFIEKDQWYLTSKGSAVRVAVRWRGSD